MRGRKPKPANVHYLNGNPGHRPINDAEPDLELGIPDTKHFFFNEKTQIYWDQHAKELEEKGILAKLDGGVLWSYCSALASLYYAEKDIDEGGWYQDTLQGGQKKRPAVSVAEKAREQIKTLSAELGLSATSRARMKIKEKPKLDSFDEYKKKKNPKTA